MKEEIADLLVAASKGDGTSAVTLHGKARFDANGMVTKI
jgi:hypothetical protein